ncbi:hypothetical protein EV356DRAFT_498622 [Viridothelium virens]|uniref:Aromatic-L-amino-acid decarboxylase n=1 Tax=Viridothelium virens TaxID=1048519 RepID=A0A6A6HDL8_VIRVR|nr:hypothetical protein EV356DRAFT_498622 [Viridothelium virens]
MNSQQFREAAHAAVDEIINYYETLPSRRVQSAVEPGYLAPLLPAGPPEDGEPWPSIQRDIESKIMPGLTHWQSPNFMAWFPANATYPSMLAELYSAAFTAPAFNWLCSPAVTELETVVLDWLAKILALPECYLSTGEGGGVIQGSASEAVVTVAVAARERFVKRKFGEMAEGNEKDELVGRLRAKMVGLASDQAHSCSQKAMNIAGTKFRSIPTRKENEFAMTGGDLRQAIEQCKRDGLEPYYLTVSLGATPTCAVDRFEEIAEVAQEYPDIWIHVDAAYAGAALVCEEYQHLTKAFGSFDSFDMNMHKWLLTNFDASCLFIKKRSELTSALSITPSYLRSNQYDAGLVTDYRDWQIPLGRRFRSLKIWFVMRSYGINGFKAHIRRHVKLGEMFANLIRGRGDLFEVVTPPAFALTVFTIKPRKGQKGDEKAAEVTNGFTPDAGDQDVVEANRITKEVYERVNASGEIFLTSGVVAGIYAIRVVSANERTEEKYLQKAFDILVKTAEEVLEKDKPNSVQNGDVKL